MAIAVVGSVGVTTNTPTQTLPASVASGELLLAMVNHGGGSTHLGATGYTQIGSTLIYGGTSGGLSFWYKIAGASETGQVFSFGAASYTDILTVRVTGFDAAAPIGTTSSSSAGSVTAGPWSNPGLTTGRNGNGVFFFFGDLNATGVTNPTSWSLGTEYINLDSNWGALATIATAGPTGAVTMSAPSGTMQPGIFAIEFNVPSTGGSIVTTGPSGVTTLPSNHAGNISLSLVGTGTAWSGATTFTVTGVSGWTKASQTVTNGTHATVVVTPPAAATPPGGATGTLTISDGVSSGGTIAVATPTLAASLSGTNLTLTGTNTLWSTDTPTFAVTAPLTTQGITTNTAATGTIPTLTFKVTDPSTGAQSSSLAAQTVGAGGGGATFQRISRQNPRARC